MIGMEHRKRSLYNLLCSGLGLIVTVAIGLLLPRLYITGYGSETNGLLTSVNQYLVCLGLFEAGVGGAAVQALLRPVAIQDISGINAILSATSRFYRRMGMFYVISLVVFSLVFPLIARSDLPWTTVVGAALLSGLGTALLFFFHGKYRVLLEAEGKNYILTNLTTAANILTGLAKVVLARSGAPVLLILGAGLLVQCLSVACILLYVRKGYGWIDLNVEPNERAIAQKSSVLVHEISGMIFQNTDVLLLTVFKGLKIVSVYAVYRFVITEAENVLSVFSGSVSFSLGQTFQTDRKTFMKRIDRFESLLSALAGGVFASVLPLFVPFVRLYTRGVTDISYESFEYALLFVASALLSAARKPMLLTIQYAGHFRDTRTQTIVESIINLSVSLFCVQRFGIAGVLFGTIAALLYRTIDIWIYANHVLLCRSCRKSVCIHLLTLGIFVMLQMAFFALQPSVTGYIKLCCIGIIEVCVSFTACIGAQCFFFPDVKIFLQEEIERIARIFYRKERKK